jgi:putative endonuclease
MAWVYILYSRSLDSYYIGSTDDLIKRVDRHNRGTEKYTRRGVPWELVYREEFVSKSEAYRRELAIKKKKSRRYIEWLIHTTE